MSETTQHDSYVVQLTAVGWIAVAVVLLVLVVVVVWLVRRRRPKL